MKDLVKILTEKNLTIGSVESMTGGLFASTICEVPGASKIFKGSIVSYSIEVKENVVGVSKDSIEKYGVVSKEVAEEMALHGQEKLKTNIVISVTGNAGPTCEPGGEPVGSVYLGLYIEGKVFSKHLKFIGNRNTIRLNTFFAMRDFILEKISA